MNEENRGALFANTRKKTEKHPDYTGVLNVEGDDLTISGWIKTDKATGKKFLSLSVRPRDEEISMVGDDAFPF